jgi:hypothetical protein
MLKNFLCFAFVLLAAHVHAQEARTVYRGTLAGVGDLVMELRKSAKEAGQYEGRYFYLRHGVDIPLKGTLEALQEPHDCKERRERREREGEEYAICDDLNGENDPSPKFIWQGKISGEHFRGKVIATDSNKGRAFDLKRVARYTPSSNDESSMELGFYRTEITWQTAPYDYLRLEGFSLPTGEIVGDAKVAYQMYRDPRSVFLYPRLVRHPDLEVLKKINFLLEQSHWRGTLGALSCRASIYSSDGVAAGSLADYDEEQIIVTWLSPTLMSFVESGSLYCGGAHPYNHVNPTTLDLIRGERLAWNRLFKVYVKNEYGGNVSSPELYKLIERIGEHPEWQLESYGDCGLGGDEFYVVPLFEEPGKLSLALSGLPHVSSACNGTHAEIPFSALGNFMKPEAKRYIDAPPVHKSPQ